MLNRKSDRIEAEVFLAGKENSSGKDSHEKSIGNRSDKIKKPLLTGYITLYLRLMQGGIIVGCSNDVQPYTFKF